MRGFFDKYQVTKADGTPTDPAARYFVLRYDTDPAARKALAVYARCVEATNPVLAKDLRDILAGLGVCPRCGGPLDDEGFCYCGMDATSYYPFDPSKEPA